jgi:hypothetical protein
MTTRTKARMASEDPLAQGQKLYVEALSDCTEHEQRTELSLLFRDLLHVAGPELEPALRPAYNALRTQRERESGPNIEQALKAVVG